MNRYENLCKLIHDPLVSMEIREGLATALDNACDNTEKLVYRGEDGVDPICPASLSLVLNEICARLDGIDERLAELENRRQRDTF